ncbi:MAG: tetratricopeptide repeat protein, partial [Burkholderiales bacterium]
MRFEDAFGLEMSTDSPVAHEAYLDAVERFLCALPGMEAAAQRAIDADPRCALARTVLARAHQLHGRGAEARAAMTGAVLAVAGQSERERSHVHTLERVVMGDGAGAMAAARSHLQTWPRDFMVMAPCAGVFGLIGFSGLAGREQAL